ncbi:MAG TPA: VWA domain-containing protein [Solirubrobacteraceae bacterium]|nr:VWA domain-containing protein [Solirubrobacteraceae bacterium]
MSFAAPAILIALVAVPLLTWWYIGFQARRARVAAAFVTPAMTESVAPDRPGWRRHAPMVAFALALTALIIAAARPESKAAVPVDEGAVFLANDVSSSMAATDVKPSRLGAAIHADRVFLAHIPDTVKVGALKFTTSATVLQSPTTDHQLVSNALENLRAYGHTAIGNAIELASSILNGLRGPDGRHVPGAIVLLSDGGSNNGVDPIAAARQAAAEHIPVYTIALGTARGTIEVYKHRRFVSVPVPVAPAALKQIAAAGKGISFTAADATSVSAIYRHLAAELGHKTVKHEVTASFAGAGLALLVIGGGMSLLWFGRLV